MVARFFAAVLVALCLAGCATGYQPKGFGGGFSEVRLNEDTYSINVRGNGFTDRERAKNIALLRASELTTAAGYDRFILVSGGVESKVTGFMPVTTQMVGRTAVTDGGEPIVKPEADYVIRMVRATDPAYLSAFDAKLIFAQLRPLFPADRQPG